MLLLKKQKIGEAFWYNSCSSLSLHCWIVDGPADLEGRLGSFTYSHVSYLTMYLLAAIAFEGMVALSGVYCKRKLAVKGSVLKNVALSWEGENSTF